MPGLVGCGQSLLAIEVSISWYEKGKIYELSFHFMPRLLMLLDHCSCCLLLGLCTVTWKKLDYELQMRRTIFSSYILPNKGNIRACTSLSVLIPLASNINRLLLFILIVTAQWTGSISWHLCELFLYDNVIHKINDSQHLSCQSLLFILRPSHLLTE